MNKNKEKINTNISLYLAAYKETLQREIVKITKEHGKETKILERNEKYRYNHKK